MTIGEVAKRTGLAPSAIRFYEEERLIQPAGRRSGRRVFDERALAQLAVVELAKRAGFTLAEVRQLVTDFGKTRWRRLAERKLGEVREAARRLETMTILLEKLLGCRCPDLDVCGRVIQGRARPEQRP